MFQFLFFQQISVFSLRVLLHFLFTLRIHDDICVLCTQILKDIVSLTAGFTSLFIISLTARFTSLFIIG